MFGVYAVQVYQPETCLLHEADISALLVSFPYHHDLLQSYSLHTSMQCQSSLMSTKQMVNWLSTIQSHIQLAPSSNPKPSSVTFMVARSHEGTTLCSATCTDAQTYGKSNWGHASSCFILQASRLSACHDLCVWIITESMCFQPVML